MLQKTRMVLSVQLQWCINCNYSGRRSCQFRVPDLPRMKSWGSRGQQQLFGTGSYRNSPRSFSKSLLLEVKKENGGLAFAALWKLQPQGHGFWTFDKFQSWFNLNLSDLQWYMCEYFRERFSNSPRTDALWVWRISLAKEHPVCPQKGQQGDDRASPF